MNRQPFTEAEMAQIARNILPQAREQAKEEAKAAADKLCADAFVGGDKSPAEACALHRTMQKKAIDRENKWAERGEKMLMGILGGASLGGAYILLIAVIEYLKKRIQQ